MKKLLALPLAATMALGAACANTPTALAPGGPDFELVDAGQRISADKVNAHVYGSFSDLSFTYKVGTPGGIGPIESGRALGFPGNPKNAGTCDMGLWINPQGKRTSGSMTKPHPHCVGAVEGSETEETMVVVLEPISATFTTSEDRKQGQTWQRELSLGTDLYAKVIGNGAKTEAVGVIVAYAIDASTLNSGSPVRVGQISFNLIQFASPDVNYFEKECSLSDEDNAPRCLNNVIEATFTPSAAYADKLVTREVTGFLYWVDAKTPFNYSDM
jgi:hypothetical protein